VAVTKILADAGVKDVVVLDSKGIVESGRSDLSETKQFLAASTNPRGISGGIGEALDGADVFIGVSGGTIDEVHLEKMADDAIIFALSNPNPEVTPDIAAKYATVVATGRSDFPNQINNVLAFPGIFRGALDADASEITDDMKLVAARAIADLVGDDLASRLCRARCARFAVWLRPSPRRSRSPRSKRWPSADAPVRGESRCGDWVRRG
jgi:malate dehydrogenase (oxaloacetate-decarboxylating)